MKKNSEALASQLFSSGVSILAYFLRNTKELNKSKTGMYNKAVL